MSTITSLLASTLTDCWWGTRSSLRELALLGELLRVVANPVDKNRTQDAIARAKADPPAAVDLLDQALRCGRFSISAALLSWSLYPRERPGRHLRRNL